MSLDLFSDTIREKYEIHEWKHACAILKEDFPHEWNDIINVLDQFCLKRSWIANPGGSKSQVSKHIDSYLYAQGWVEKEFSTHVIVLVVGITKALYLED